MRSIYLFWCLSFGILPTIVCAQTLQDRETRERLSVVEEKISALTEKVIGVETSLTALAKKQEDTGWSCAGFCFYWVQASQKWKTDFAIEEGRSAGVAMQSLYDQCMKKALRMDSDHQYEGLYSDYTHNKRADIQTACLKD